MYVYEGLGYLVGIDYKQTDGNSVAESDFTDAFYRATGLDVESMEEIDDAMTAGDWNSPDNTSEATLDGEEVYGSRGVMIALDSSPETTECLTEVLRELRLDPENFHGYVFVECYD